MASLMVYANLFVDENLNCFAIPLCSFKGCASINLGIPYCLIWSKEHIFLVYMCDKIRALIFMSVINI